MPGTTATQTVHKAAQHPSSSLQPLGSSRSVALRTERCARLTGGQLCCIFIYSCHHPQPTPRGNMINNPLQLIIELDRIWGNLAVCTVHTNTHSACVYTQFPILLRPSCLSVNGSVNDIPHGGAAPSVDKVQRGGLAKLSSYSALLLNGTRLADLPSLPDDCPLGTMNRCALLPIGEPTASGPTGPQCVTVREYKVTVHKF